MAMVPQQNTKDKWISSLITWVKQWLTYDCLNATQTYWLYASVITIDIT